MAKRKSAGKKAAAKKATSSKRKPAPTQARKQANQIIQDAEDLPEAQQVIEYRRALELCPDHIAAHIKLAEVVQSAEESLKFLDAAIEIQERLLGDQLPHLDLNQPGVDAYLRTLRFRSTVLEELGRTDEMLDQLGALLDLDPDDGSGYRFELMQRFANLRRWDELDELLSEYSDDLAVETLYMQALATFHREGESEQAKECIDEAITTGPEAVKYLTGQINPVDQESFDHEDESDESAARSFARSILPAWRGTPGAITWLKASAARLKKEDETLFDEPAEKQEDPHDVMRRLRSSVKKLPQEETEPWLADVRILGTQASWGMMVANVEASEPMGMASFGAEPEALNVVAELLKIMLEPADGQPRRPGLIELTNQDLVDDVADLLEPFKIEVRLSERADEINSSFKRDLEPLPNIPVTDIDQSPELVWEMDWAQFGIWTEDDSGAPIQPWTITIVNPDSEDVVATHVTQHEPELEDMINTLRSAIIRPMLGEPERPALIRVRTADNRVMLAKWLREADIEVETGDLPVYDAICESITQKMMGDMQPGLTEIEGVGLNLVEQLYEATVHFYRDGTWARVSPDEVVKLTCPDLTDEPWFGLIMGQRGTGLGMMLLKDEEVVRSLLTGDDFEDRSDELRGISLNLDEKFVVSPADVAAAEQFGWPVAADEAWPGVIAINGNEGPRAVDVEELRWMVACLNVIPKFWAERGKLTSIPVEVDGESVVVEAELQRM
jgi:hypothetical protein